MPNQYVASDPRTGLQVQVTGTFPEAPDDRVRIARTTNLFTRLMGTILSTDSETERRDRFRAVETQLEVADALIRGDIAEVQRLIHDTMQQMGVTDEQLREVEEQLREQMQRMGHDLPPGGLSSLFGSGPAPDDDPPSIDGPSEDPRPDEPRN